ncbi:hypothetical protein FKM82_002411 [Ascaphus truei]
MNFYSSLESCTMAVFLEINSLVFIISTSYRCLSKTTAHEYLSTTVIMFTNNKVILFRAVFRAEVTSPFRRAEVAPLPAGRAEAPLGARLQCWRK